MVPSPVLAFALYQMINIASVRFGFAEE